MGNAYCFWPTVPLLETTVSDATVTYLQLYTPYPKPLRERKPFTARPYTLTKVLGQDVVTSNPRFSAIKDATQGRVDYTSLIEASGAANPHHRFAARIEFVARSHNTDFMRTMDIRALADGVISEGMVFEVSSKHTVISEC